MKKGNIALNINADVVEGPRGLSIKELKYKETLANGDNVYSVIREDNNIIGEVTAKKGDKGNTGEKGDTGRGITSITKKSEIAGINYYEIIYTDGGKGEFTVEDGKNAYDIAIKNGYDGTEEEWLLSLIGKGLEFNWNGTKLGVRVEGETEYQYSDDLKGEKGDKGDIGKAFYIAKVYSSIAEMQTDFNNNTVKTGEYVIISSADEDNGKLFEKKESSFEFIVKMSGYGGGGNEYIFVNRENETVIVGNGNIPNGKGNTAVGIDNLKQITTGYNNTSLGTSALAYNTDGHSNTALGAYSLMGNMNGAENVSIGYQSSYIGAARFRNVAIGYRALYEGTFFNAIGIGYNAAVTGTSQAQIGDSSVTVYCYGAVQNRSDKRDKTDIQDTNLGLNFLMKLKPREYRWDYRENYINQEAKERELKDIENLEITEKEKEKKIDEILIRYSLENVKKDGSKKGWRLHQGFIAQEVFETMRELGVDFGGYQDHSINGGKDVLSLGYEEFIAVIVKGIQEQQKEIEELKNKIEKLEGRK